MSSIQFFEMTFVEEDEDGWELASDWLNPDGSWKDVWAFSRCELAPDSVELNFRITDEGQVRDFNIANFNIPVVSRALGELIAATEKKGIQRLPISIAQAKDEKWEVLNVLQSVDCLDYENSIIDYYPKDLSDPWVVANPTRAGLPKCIRKLRLIHEKCKGKNIFRIKNWEIPIIVSSVIKDLIEENGITGVRFIGV